MDEQRGADFAGSVASGDKKIGKISIQVKFRCEFNQKEAMEKTRWKPFEGDPRLVQIRVLVAYPKETKYQLCTVQKNLMTVIIDSRNAEHFFSSEEMNMFDYLKSTGNMDHLQHFDDICNSLGITSE